MTPGCTCTVRRRRWNPDTGVCTSCGNRVREVQIMDIVRATLIADPRCLLWRNEIGSSTHWPTGEPRKGPIRYGLANPGGADLIGFYGPRFVAVECKTPIGSQSADQIAFGWVVVSRFGVYALARGEEDVWVWLAWLRVGVAGPLPDQLQGGGSLQTTRATTA